MEKKRNKLMNFSVTERMKDDILRASIREGTSMAALIKTAITYYLSKIEQERPLKKNVLNDYFDSHGETPNS